MCRTSGSSGPRVIESECVCACVYLISWLGPHVSMGIEISDSFNTMVKVTFIYIYLKKKNQNYETALLFKNLKSQISDVVF